MEDNFSKYNALLSIITQFNNRPYHLFKYLLENDAFKEEFLIQFTEKDLNDLNFIDVEKYHFNNISEMKKYYNSLIFKITKEGKDIEEITNELNELLRKSIQEENYEQASRIRDYMLKKKIKKNF